MAMPSSAYLLTCTSWETLPYHIISDLAVNFYAHGTALRCRCLFSVIINCKKVP